MTKPHLALVTALPIREHLAQHELEKHIEVVKCSDLSSLPAWLCADAGLTRVRLEIA
jgi:hypothetical protein